MKKQEKLQKEKQEYENLVLSKYAWYSLLHLCKMLYEYEYNTDIMDYEKQIRERDDEIMEMSKEIEKLWKLLYLSNWQIK